MLDLDLHCFCDNIATVCPIFHPQQLIHCHCAFHRRCAVCCHRVAVVPSTPSPCRHAVDRRRPCAIHRRRQRCIDIVPFIVITVAVAVALCIKFIAVTLLLLWPPPSPPTFADPFSGWLLRPWVTVAPLQCHCRRCHCCCYRRHHHCPLLLIPLLVGCCGVVFAVDGHLLPGILTLFIREFAHPHRLQHQWSWAPQ